MMPFKMLPSELDSEPGPFCAKVLARLRSLLVTLLALMFSAISTFKASPILRGLRRSENSAPVVMFCWNIAPVATGSMSVGVGKGLARTGGGMMLSLAQPTRVASSNSGR